MIDLTTIQLNPIPPPIHKLQMENQILNQKNQQLIIIFGLISATLILFYTIKLVKTHEKIYNKTRLSSR